MRIAVGSMNQVKIDAAGEVLWTFESVAAGSALYGIPVPSGVSEQPKTLEETIAGASVRASRALFLDPGCDLAVGLESGVFRGDVDHGRVFDVCACALHWRGTMMPFVGLSSAWEVPCEVARFIFDHGLDMNDASVVAGLTTDSKLGNGQGLVGLLSNGRLSRKDYTKQAVLAACVSARFK